MSGIHMPRFLLPISIIGTSVGIIVLSKDSFSNKRYKGKEKLLGKTAIITGANTGLGKATASDFAKRGAKVIMACRNMGKCEAARKEIIEATYNRNVHCKRLDLASMKSIREFADDINKNEVRLDILINNAGVMRPPKSVTEDGFETQLGVNHFGPFLLTNLLLDKLKSCAPSRVVYLTARLYEKGVMDYSDLNCENNYNPVEAFKQSKLAMMMCMMEMERQLKGSGVTLNAVDPGLTLTEIMRHMGLVPGNFAHRMSYPLLWFMFSTPELGAQTTIYAAVSPDLEGVSGKSYKDLTEVPLGANAMNPDKNMRMYIISENWTHLV